MEEFGETKDELVDGFFLVEFLVYRTGFPPFADGIFDDEWESSSERDFFGRLNGAAIGAAEGKKIAQVVAGEALGKLLGLLYAQVAQAAVGVCTAADIGFRFTVANEEEFGHGWLCELGFILHQSPPATPLRTC